jgi:hypothetical protein
MNPDFPCEEVYVGEQPQFNFAEKCEKFYEAYGDKGNPPIVSPDGELSGGSMRAASLIRNGSK